MCLFLAELNGLTAYTTDVTSAYIESYTKEKLVYKAGKEFGDQAGHLFVISKALYGLLSSGLRWSELLAACLSSMGFKRSLFEPDIWMRNMGDHYEYIGTYVDDMIICSMEPMKIIEALKAEPFNFKLKGTQEMTGAVHLGSKIERDPDGVLTMNPNQYIKRMEESFNQRFPDEKIETNVMSPLEPGDHPELDTSEFLSEDDTMIYQSLIGAFQWSISIGRWGIMTAVMTLSSF